MVCLLCWRLTLLVRGTNTFCSSDECFSAGDKCFENTRSNISHAQTQLATSDFQTELITPEYVTPINYIRNSVLCLSKRPSSRLKLIEKMINELLVTHSSFLANL